MENHIDRPAVDFEVRHEVLHAGVDIQLSVFFERFQHLLPEEYLQLHSYRLFPCYSAKPH